MAAQLRKISGLVYDPQVRTKMFETFEHYVAEGIDWWDNIEGMDNTLSMVVGGMTIDMNIYHDTDHAEVINVILYPVVGNHCMYEVELGRAVFDFKSFVDTFVQPIIDNRNKTYTTVVPLFDNGLTELRISWFYDGGLEKLVIAQEHATYSEVEEVCRCRSTKFEDLVFDENGRPKWVADVVEGLAAFRNSI